jgi:hypothetical protein
MKGEESARESILQNALTTVRDYPFCPSVAILIREIFIIPCDPDIPNVLRDFIFACYKSLVKKAIHIGFILNGARELDYQVGETIEKDLVGDLPTSQSLSLGRTNPKSKSVLLSSPFKQQNAVKPSPLSSPLHLVNQSASLGRGTGSGEGGSSLYAPVSLSVASLSRLQHVAEALIHMARKSELPDSESIVPEFNLLISMAERYFPGLASSFTFDEKLIVKKLFGSSSVIGSVMEFY